MLSKLQIENILKFSCGIVVLMSNIIVACILAFCHDIHINNDVIIAIQSVSAFAGGLVLSNYKNISNQIYNLLQEHNKINDARIVEIERSIGQLTNRTNEPNEEPINNYPINDIDLELGQNIINTPRFTTTYDKATGKIVVVHQN
jgi:hypothetical protein